MCKHSFVHFFIPYFPTAEQLLESCYYSLSLIQLFFVVSSYYFCVLGISFNIVPRHTEGKVRGLKMYCRFLCFDCFCLVLFYKSTTVSPECNTAPCGKSHRIPQQPCAAQYTAVYCRVLNWATEKKLH